MKCCLSKRLVTLCSPGSTPGITQGEIEATNAYESGGSLDEGLGKIWCEMFWALSRCVPPCAAETCAVRPVFARVVGKPAQQIQEFARRAM